MNWLEIKIFFDSNQPHIAADLIADLYYGLGLKGVVIDDPDLKPDEGWGQGAVGPPGRHAVAGYIAGSKGCAEKTRMLEDGIAKLSGSEGFGYDLQVRRIDEEEWAESWKAFFWPEHITGKIVVKPTWREYVPEQDEIVLEIDPGMAFGTGTHPTTAMCVGLIEKYLGGGISFLDVGTGSGILMLAAAKFGAETLLGIDKDEIAVQIAQGNLQLNGIDPRTYHVRVGNLANGIRGRFGFIVANILFDVIEVLLDTIHNHLEKNGILVCSGIIRRHEKEVTDKMRSMGYEIMEVLRHEEWIAVACRYADRECPA